MAVAGAQSPGQAQIREVLWHLSHYSLGGILCALPSDGSLQLTIRNTLLRAGQQVEEAMNGFWVSLLVSLCNRLLKCCYWLCLLGTGHCQIRERVWEKMPCLQKPIKGILAKTSLRVLHCGAGQGRDHTGMHGTPFIG